MRHCPVCGKSLDGRDRRTITCGAKCRRERGRLARLVRGDPDGPYRTLAQYASRPRRVRAQRRGEE